MKRETIYLLTLSLAGCAVDGTTSDDETDVFDEVAQEAALDGGSVGVDAAQATPAAADAGTSKAKVGEFSLQLVAPAPDFQGGVTPGFTSLLGKVYRDVLPESLIWEKQTEANGCTLYTPRIPFCDPACGVAICVENDVCRASPASLNVGRVTVSGIKTEAGQTSFTVDPIRNNYLTPGTVRLPFPAFNEGDTIDVTAAGGDLAPFKLSASGIAPLKMAGSGSYPLETGKPLELKWLPPTGNAVSRVQVKLDISHHGGTKGKIECDVPDNGALAIPAELVDQLRDLGVAGFPTVMVTRSSVGSTMTSGGRVDLRIYSYVESPVEIPGVISCSEDSECRRGAVCRDDRTCG